MSRRTVIITLIMSFSVSIAVLFANSSVVWNGTNSLPHNGYFMVNANKYVPKGSFVAFNPPKKIKQKYPGVAFVKRVVGGPGDEIKTDGVRVCVNDECRYLQEELVTAGYPPLQSGIIPENRYVVFGDSPDSLDSRYDFIGLLPQGEIIATGYPIPIPNWKEVRKWFGI